MSAISSLITLPVVQPIIGAEELSILLKRKNINSDRCYRPHTLPEACVIPGTKKPLWLLEDVVNWLRQFKESPKSPKKEISKVRRGAPTKSERIAKRKLKVEDLTEYVVDSDLGGLKLEIKPSARGRPKSKARPSENLTDQN